MVNRSAKKVFIFVVSVNLVVVILVTWFLFYSISSFRTNEILVEKAGQESANLNSPSRGQSGYLAKSLDDLNAYFVSPEGRVALLAELEALAAQSGITYVLNSANDGPQISLDLNVRGTFQNIYYFIRLLESSGYWVSFENVSLSKGTDGKWSGSLVVSIPNVIQ